jgi:DNA mismatch repair protein MutS
MKLTPGMQQYMDAKEKHPDCILLFRMGDFYETFFDDAKLIAAILNVTLTHRGKGETKAPLAGIPYHSIDKYLPKLVAAGHKVAICEQVEDPKKAKGIVKREVVRIITPGTVVEDAMLSDNQNNFIACVYGEENFGLSFIDVSTGEFLVTHAASLHDVKQELLRKKTAEIVVAGNYNPENFKDFCQNNNIFVSRISDDFFWPTKAMSILQQELGIRLSDVGLQDAVVLQSSIAGLLSHIGETQKQSIAYLQKPKLYDISAMLKIDASTIKNLEIVKNIHDGSSRGTLLSVLDETKSAMGSRLLKQWLVHPLCSIDGITKRHEAVSALCANSMLTDDLKDILGNIHDIERLMSKISYKLTSPKDAITLMHSLKAAKQIPSLVSSLDSQLLKELCIFPDVSAVTELIASAFNEDESESVIVRSGAGYSEGGSGRRQLGIIKSGYNAELDELYELKANAKTKIRDLETTEQEKTGMTLKVGYNKVFGYYIEVTNKFKDLVPDHYIRKQTLVGGERFITQELKDFEEKIINADEKIIAIEDVIIAKVFEIIVAATKDIQDIALKIASIDVLASFASVAKKHNYVRPIMHDGYDIDMKDSRHPVIECIESEFIPNDASFTNNSFLMLITGPNMAGKSTYMRQVALCMLMAHIGCFVPATSAKIPIVDQIFSRVGAYDDLSQGQSTFMVEMLETAHILQHATNKSFIILDEIGRGTSTFDGVAIAWSVAEYILENIKAKTLFATHYHVLTKLENSVHTGVANYNIAVAEHNDSIVFLRKIKKGGTDKSYGIHVAKLAGVPQKALAIAKRVQKQLEEDIPLDKKIVMKEGKNIPNQKTLDF